MTITELSPDSLNYDCWRMLDQQLHKRCPRCGESLPATTFYFHVNKGRLHAWCKDCYLSDPKQVEKRRRYIEKRRTQSSLAHREPKRGDCAPVALLRSEVPQR